ncbi:MAG: hypothetical protein ACTSR0_03255 [Candidatus Asgardarchaeia archaeon]
MMEMIMVSMATGMALGFLLRKRYKTHLDLSRIYFSLIYVLIFIIGLKLGYTVSVKGLLLYGFHSLIFSISTVIFSVLLASLLFRRGRR